MLGFIPCHPDGSLLYGILVGNHRVRGSGRYMPLDWLLAQHSVSSAIASIRICALPRAISSMGVGLSHEVTRRVLLHNTLFGYYEKGLTGRLAESWLLRILQGPLGPSRRHRVQGQRIGHLDGLRWCSSCSEADVATGMLPCWRVVHQLPFVHHCPEHKVALLSHCAKCGAVHDRGCDSRLPGDPCRLCGSYKADEMVIKTSQGYWACLDFASDIYKGKYPGMRADAWWDLFGSASVSADPSFHRNLREKALTRWDASDEGDLLRSVRFDLASKFELDVRDVSTFSPSLFERIVVADALEAMRSIDTREHLKCGPGLSARQTSRTAVDQFAISALDFGIPPGVAIMLTRKSAPSEICGRYKVSRTAVAQFVESLPLELRSKLQAEVGDGWYPDAPT